MAGGVKELRAGDVLFREGDPSEAMYVIKKGRIAITKAKGEGEIQLAELKAGEMLGEMAFFDNKPRSAGAKALLDAQVIELPFSALHAQFKTFPEWLKAMVKTVNSNLRNANQRIKNLESLNSEGAEVFPPHTVTRMGAIISLITFKAGEKQADGTFVVPSGLLRNYTIQVFQQPTHKMQKYMQILSGLGLMKVEDLGEGRQKITVLNHDVLTRFVDWYNEYLFKEESKRITVEEKELPVLKALAFYGKKQSPDDKGKVKISLTEMQNSSMKDLNQVFTVNDADSLAKKGLTDEKTSGEGGVIFLSFNLKDVETIIPFWEIVFSMKKAK